MEWTPIIDCAYAASFTIGSVGATMTCTIQLKDFAGKNLTVKSGILVYFTTDADGNTKEELGASVVVATHGIVYELTSKYDYLLITEDNGVVAITVDGDGATSTYVNVVLPDGKVATSSVMAFNA